MKATPREAVTGSLLSRPGISALKGERALQPASSHSCGQQSEGQEARPHPRLGVLGGWLWKERSAAL